VFELSKEILDTHEVLLTVKMEDDVFEQGMQRAVRKLARKHNFPGFRKGKAPYHIVLRHLGAETVRAETLEALVEENYADWIKQAEIKALSLGELESVTDAPHTLVFRIPLVPEIDLGDYLSLRKPVEEIVVTDEEVSAGIQAVRVRAAKLELVERPAALGDMLILQDLVGVEDGEEVIHQHHHQVVLDPEQGFIASGGIEELVGLAAGESKAFTLQVPDDDGIEAPLQISVVVDKVYSMELPPLDDAFASTIGPFETMDALREAFRDGAFRMKEEHAAADYTEAVVELLMQQSEVRYPPVMVEAELDDHIEELTESLRKEHRISLEDALRLQGKTLEQFRESLRPETESRLKYGLMLGKLMSEENITLTEENRAEFEAFLEVHAPKNKFERERLEDRFLSQKTLARLVQISRGETIA